MCKYCFLIFWICNLWGFHLQAKSLASSHLNVDLTIPGSTTFAPYAVIVPFTFSGGLVILKARVNQMEGNFILDTGASGLVLNERYFSPDHYQTDITGMGLAGETSQVGAMLTDSFHLDELTFTNTAAQTIDLSQIEENKRTRILGLIGYDLLKDFELMLDYRQRFLTFSKTDKWGNVIGPLPHTLNKVDSLSFTLANFIPLIPVKVNGKEKQMGLDTGAEYNLLHLYRSKDILDHFKILKTLKITNTGQQKVEALAGKLSRVTFLDKYRCGAMSTVLTNLQELEAVYQCRLDGILGYEFFATWIVSINYKKHQLFLHQPEVPRP